PGGGGGGGLRPGDLGGGPERAVHALARDEVTRVVHDGDADLEAEGLRLGNAALDALVGSLQRERHRQGTCTQTVPPSIRVASLATPLPRLGITHSPLRT